MATSTSRSKKKAASNQADHAAPAEDPPQRADPPDPSSAEVEPAEDDGEEPAQKLTLRCQLTGEDFEDTDQERTLQQIITQFHREYGIPLALMARDVRIPCSEEDPKSGAIRTRKRTAHLVVYDPRSPIPADGSRPVDDIIRVALVLSRTTKVDEKAIALLDIMLANLSNDRPEVFGVCTNGDRMEFRRRSYDEHGNPVPTPLTDIPAPDETLEDLENSDRRPLRVAAGDSLLRTFKGCHDYLYGNQSMRNDRAFWQLLHLIFCKIYDERLSRRIFFVGATEANSEAGRHAIAERIKGLFKKVRDEAYSDVFAPTDQIELNDRALSYVAGELSRYSLLSTDTDAKGMAYEAITSNTLKKDRGQFFTPRNVIRMMVEMLDPKPGERVLDPACGSGGFLVVTLAHVRRQLLAEIGADPDQPVPSELKRVDHKLQAYARSCLHGIDVDTDLRKAARMNMVMNNDGHGNIHCFNSLEYGIPKRHIPAMDAFEKSSGKHGTFDVVLTNPPFGAKIPITDPVVLENYDLGHAGVNQTGHWANGGLLSKVAPEILFIEACYKFLKPGTGRMMLVMPNGILGNPGQQMEFVRWWMLSRMELLASVDLPGEAFLPQVSVQASCVLLRRRAAHESKLGNKPKQHPVFMAIAQACGHGRRGETRYVRRPDGSVDLREVRERARWERKDGQIQQEERSKWERLVDDDMPWIAAQYGRFLRGEPFEERR